jgi:hypothetical protein
MDMPAVVKYTDGDHAEHSSVSDMDLKRIIKPTAAMFQSNREKYILHPVVDADAPLPKVKVCAWDHHAFDGIPIGIPVRYVSGQRECIYRSHTATKKKTSDKPSNTIFGLTQNVLYGLSIPATNTECTHPRTTGRYVCMHMFCSFNCALAYLYQHNGDPIFRNSICLLGSLYYDIYKQPMRISPAPPVEMLTESGGVYTLVQFRHASEHVTFQPTQFHGDLMGSAPVLQWVPTCTKFTVHI